MVTELAHYTSYLVRVWQEDAAESQPVQWRAEVEHVQSGVRRCFRSPAELWAFLRQLDPMGDDNDEIDT